MAGEGELDAVREGVPLGMEAVRLGGAGYMDDKLTGELARLISAEDGAIGWECWKACYNEPEAGSGGSYSRMKEDQEGDIEFGHIVSKMANVVSFTLKHNRYGRYAVAGLTLRQDDGADFAHGFGVRMSPAGLSKADGKALEKGEFKALEDRISLRLRRGKVELYRNGAYLEDIGDAPAGCVSMYAKVFIREADLQVSVLHSATCTNVSEIDCSGNRIGDGGASALAEVLEKDTNLVTRLDLRLNRVRDAGAVRLAQAMASGFCRLAHLDLSHNTIGDEGAAALAAALREEKCLVSFLDLTDNDVGDDGCVALASALAQESCGVTTVRLALNEIGSAGIVALAEALEKSSCSVTEVAVGQNRAERPATRRLAQAFARTPRLRVVE